MQHRLAAVALFAACAPSTPRSSSPSAAIASPVAARDAGRCLPLVSGCGCAYVCAATARVLADGAHEVIHDLQDSRLDRATLARWCFDDAGHGSPAAAATSTQRRCIEVFFDGTPCGGECVPRTDTLRCASVGGRCAPSPTGDAR